MRNGDLLLKRVQYSATIMTICKGIYTGGRNMVGKVIEGRYFGCSVYNSLENKKLYIKSENSEIVLISKNNAVFIDDVSTMYYSDNGKAIMVMWNDFETSIIQLRTTCLNDEVSNDFCVKSNKSTAIPNDFLVSSRKHKTKASNKKKGGCFGAIISLVVIIILILITRISINKKANDFSNKEATIGKELGTTTSHPAEKELVAGEWIELKVDGIDIKLRFDNLTPIQDKGSFGTFVMMLCAIENVSNSDFDAFYFFEENVKITDAEGFTLSPSHYGWDYDVYDCGTEVASGEKRKIVKAFGYSGNISDLKIMINDDEYAYTCILPKQVSDRKAISETTETPSTALKEKDNYNNVHSCAECGKSASKTYSNPFSGKQEYYCTTHYQKIIDIMSMMEDDVGSSKQSKHTCEQCSREGTHRYESFTGQTEYYCTQHYEELKDLLDAFGLS